MIKHLTELVQELNERGYEWNVPIVVGQEYVRVKDGCGTFYYHVYRKEEGKFEIVVSAEGLNNDLSVTERETIEQVVDYIME